MENRIMISLVILLSVISFIGGYVCSSSKYDLPEEIDIISNEFSKPDTLIGYRDGLGVIHIGYLNR